MRSPLATAVTRNPARSDDDASTRERMLDVALGAFAELGYDGASTRTIAGRAGVNQGLIPYHFGSKEALWREAVDRVFAELRHEFGPLLAEADPATNTTADRIEPLIRSLVRFVARRPEFARLMSDEGKRDGPRMRWIVDRHVRPLYQATQTALDRVRQEGLLPGAVTGLDPLHLYYILVGAVTQLFHQAPECRRLTGRDPADEAMVEAHADALVALFVGPSPRREAK